MGRVQNQQGEHEDNSPVFRREEVVRTVARPAAMWSAEDFVAAPLEAEKLVDFWALPEPAVTTRVKSCKETEKVEDFWVEPETEACTVQAGNSADATTDVARTEASGAGDWIWTLPQDGVREEAAPSLEAWADWSVLDGFVPGAAENPYTIVDRQPRREDITAKRARWLVSLMDIPEPRRRREYVRFFEELFDRFPHYNAYRVLTNLALDDRVRADELLEACRFRLEFLERNEWWGWRNFGRTVIYAAEGTGLMSWAEALRLTKQCGGNPSSYISDEWLDEWLNIPAENRDVLRFVDYLRLRLSLVACGVWQIPAMDVTVNRSPEWKRLHGLPSASPFARTAHLVNLKSISEEFRPK